MCDCMCTWVGVFLEVYVCVRVCVCGGVTARVYNSRGRHVKPSPEVKGSGPYEAITLCGVCVAWLDRNTQYAMCVMYVTCHQSVTGTDVGPDPTKSHPSLE